MHVNVANRLSVLYLLYPYRLSSTPTVASKLVHSDANTTIVHPHLNVNHRLLQLYPTLFPSIVEVRLESCPKTHRGNREEGEKKTR